ncbi:putative peptidyl-arginine deiminase family protein [Cordyceps militaris CM01]|uniref:Putative peptidyl-arginine deiminase family protein n=1 Tax=Cordyceps militaris (strain CM01) TaxID=983644 RepID=G3JUR4_CORMM|nr:putative peptidyl-arginine deiminase family protein [Cordyceps militaris CM01]EGX87864.1 putative peptidyl-arginine deiminase family protein [Cordyceps militaris CM01]
MKPSLLLLASSPALAAYFRPAEWGAQSSVIMAWPSGDNPAYHNAPDDLSAATEDISNIAAAVAKFEPVTLLVVQSRLADAQAQFADRSNITLLPIATYPTLDLWMRDMAPTFVLDRSNTTGQLAGVDYNFNGWGGKFPTGSCLSLASLLSYHMKVPRVDGALVSEGGSLEVDGEGTLLVTESSVLIDNRNPGTTKAQAEAAFEKTLGVTKTIWIPGRRGSDITDGHIDGLARFIAPGRVLLSRPSSLEGGGPFVDTYREARAILANTTDARGRVLHVTEIAEAELENIGADKELVQQVQDGQKDYPSLTYVNYVMVNGGIVFAAFGDKEADAAALKLIQGLYPDRTVEVVNTQTLAFLGGGIHCSTQEVPASE